MSQMALNIHANKGGKNFKETSPFYSDANMRRLRKAIADVKSGKSKLTEHELVEAKND